MSENLGASALSDALNVDRRPATLAAQLTTEYLMLSSGARDQFTVALIAEYTALRALHSMQERQSAAESASVQDQNNKHRDPASAGDQGPRGGGDGGGAVPGRNPATVPAASRRARTGTVEPAAGPAESCPMAAGQIAPDAGDCLPDPG